MTATSESPRVLLLESIHEVARDRLSDQGFRVSLLDRALNEEELCEQLPLYDAVGIRSKTQVTRAALDSARGMLAVGAFCIGTNQIDLEAATEHGIPVFNAPFSNTRSVAELIVSQVVMLARGLGDRVREMHEGRWRKTAAGAHEVRGKTIGVVGYGHIGSQVGVLAEGFGLRVLYHDIVTKLPMGNNQSCGSLDELLAKSDFVSLHVPATPQTHMMIGDRQLRSMKPGAYLLNLSRGTVVDIPALAKALSDGHLAGASVDVFPKEPKKNISDDFESELVGLENVILTPHIGGSTVEAQENIGREVSATLTRYIQTGATGTSVNFPHVDLPLAEGVHRLTNVHRNVPGVLRDINRIVSDAHANIQAQVLSTTSEIGYLIMDLDSPVTEQVVERMGELENTIRARMLS